MLCSCDIAVQLSFDVDGRAGRLHLFCDPLLLDSAGANLGRPRFFAALSLTGSCVSISVVF